MSNIVDDVTNAASPSLTADRTAVIVMLWPGKPAHAHLRVYEIPTGNGRMALRHVCGVATRMSGYDANAYVVARYRDGEGGSKMVVYAAADLVIGQRAVPA